MADQRFSHTGAVVPGAGISQRDIGLLLDQLPGPVIAVLGNSTSAVNAGADTTSLIIKHIAAGPCRVLSHSQATGSIIDVLRGAAGFACCILADADQPPGGVVGLGDGLPRSVSDANAT